MGAEVIEKWGTWEELLLGGAVLRHGTKHWNLVAAELRARTACPYTFTPEVCKARYEDLQRRFAGCKAWFEELRKQRMAELRRALELSENSIGFLELKLKTLKAEKGDNDCNVENYSSQIESPVEFQKVEVVVSSSKDTSKDGLSAGSYTRETPMNWTSESQNPIVVPCENMDDAKPDECLKSSEQDKVLSIDKLKEIICGRNGRSLKRRRGKRKRRDIKEGNVGESEFKVITNVIATPRCEENPTSESGQLARYCGIKNQSKYARKEDDIDDLMGIFESISHDGNASVFRRRLDSQKRGRYKKLIRQHVDLDMVRSRILRRSITSAKELFRDLLLLANNAVIFYSKNTREHKCGMLLRSLVTKNLRQHLNDKGKEVTTSNRSFEPPMRKPPVKPRSARPGSHKVLSGKLTDVEKLSGKGSNRGKKPGNADSPPLKESLVSTKKFIDKSRKPGRSNAAQQAETAARGRKRVRAR